jgi:hypothetical protein
VKLEPQCLAQRVIVPFYTAKGMIYNARVTGGLYYILSKDLHCNAHD